MTFNPQQHLQFTVRERPSYPLCPNVDPTFTSSENQSSFLPPFPTNHAHSTSTTTIMSSPLPPPPPPHLLPHHHQTLPLLTSATITRRSLLLSASLSTLSPPPQPPLDTTITDRMFLDFSICSTYIRPDRTLSSTFSSLCTDPIPLGRLVIGLYGHLVPLTVSNFKTMCTSSSYKNTLVNKIFPGQFFLAGKQGRREKGEVQVPQDLARNTDTVESKAFMLTHSRAGVVSLCLSENDDEDDVKLDPNYRNVEFLITTGPGPCPQLDYKNIVFGVVLEGLDVVTSIASIPTYKPSERIRQFNDLAEFLGDERAQNARTIWNKPLKTVYISDCGEFRVTKPSLSPSLP